MNQVKVASFIVVALMAVCAISLFVAIDVEAEERTVTPGTVDNPGTELSDYLHDTSTDLVLTINLDPTVQYTLKYDGSFHGVSLVIDGDPENTGSKAEIKVSGTRQINTNTTTGSVVEVRNVDFVMDGTSADDSTFNLYHYKSITFEGCTANGVIVMLSSKDTDSSTVTARDCTFSVDQDSRYRNLYALTLKGHTLSADNVIISGYDRGLNMEMSTTGKASAVATDCNISNIPGKCALQFSYGTEGMTVEISDCVFDNCAAAISVHNTTVGSGKAVSSGNTFTNCGSDFLYSVGGNQEPLISNVGIISVGDDFDNKNLDRSSEDGTTPITAEQPVTVSWYDSDATSYDIGNIKELQELALLVNSGVNFEGKTINLAKGTYQLPAIWTPIGNNYRTDSIEEATRYFSGTFNGNGSTIVGLSDASYSPGTANLDGDEYLFGLFGYTYNAIISNLTLTEINLTGTSSGRVGDSLGALVGYGLGTLTVSNIEVNGAISANDATGGVVGRFYGTEISVIDCNNHATVKSNGKTGGIVGAVSLNVLSATLTDCTNDGDVTGSLVGGIVGLMGKPGNSTTTFAFTRCTNTGTISANAAGNSSTGAGGILGWDMGNDTNNGTISFTDCKNSGAICRTDLKLHYGGGIAGYINGTVSLTGCENTASVYGTDNTGGMTGNVHGSLTATGCRVINNPSISGTYAAGGIVGTVGGTDATIDSCVVSATVSVSDRMADDGAAIYGYRSGQVIGFAGQLDVTVRNMSDSGMELIGATYSIGEGDRIVFENCDLDTTLVWSMNGAPDGPLTLELINSQLEGLEFYKGRLVIEADAASSIGTLVAGSQSSADYLKDVGQTTGGGVRITIASETMLNVISFTEVDNTDTAFSSTNNHVLGTDETSYLRTFSEESTTTYVWSPNDTSGTWTAVEGISVSVEENDETMFVSSVTEAIENIDSKGTITLLESVTENVTIPAGKNIIINLNGYKITGVSNGTVITNNGTLTLKNGTVDAGTANGSVAVSNSGTLTVGEDEGFSTLLTGCFAISGGTATSVLTITGGTFESNGSTDRSNALYVTGDVTITGGVFTSEGRSNAGLPRTSAIHITGDSSTLLINPGDEQVVVFSEDNFAITIEGDITATICGGTFTSDGPRDELYRANDVGSFVISGGTFAHEPSSDHIAEHHTMVREGNVYTVIPQPTKVDTSVTDIGLLANSLATNASVELTITITGNVTIPSGYDLTLKQGHTLVVQSGSTLTVEGILRLEGNLDNNGTVATAGSGYIEKILNMSAGGTEAGLPNLDDNGTYHVSTPMELQWLAFLVANGTNVTSVVLDNNIVMPSGVGFTEIGTYESPVKDMVFDGQGHTISGIDMDQEPNVKYMGIFGQIVDTTIKNLNIDSADIDVMWSYAGILVGLAQGDCVIENVHISDSSIDGLGSFGLAAFVGYSGSGETSRSLQFIGCSAKNVTIDAQCNAGALWGTSSGYNSDIGVYNCAIEDVQISSEVTIGIYGGFGSTAVVKLIGPEHDADLTLAGNTVTGPTVGNQYPAPELSVGTAVLRTDGWSVLTQGMEPEARIDGKMFASIEDAIQLASDGDTIVLLADVTDGMTFDEDMTLTVDLNGQTIRNSDDLAVITVSSGSVTISGTGTFTPGSGGTTASVADGANLAIIGGTYTEDISDYVPDGYRVVEDTDSNTYTVVAEHTVTFVLSPSTAGVTVTDAQGNRYQVADGTIALIPGTYTITVSASGYTTQTQSLVIDSTSDISLTVSVTLSPRPSGGGGTVTPPQPQEPDIEEHPDGSTTETVTDTTTNTDGSRTETTTVTEKDPEGNVTGSTVTETTTSETNQGGVQESTSTTTVTTSDGDGNVTGSTTSSTTTTVTDTTTTVTETEEVRDSEGNVTSSSERVTETTQITGGTMTSETTTVTDASGNTSTTESVSAESEDSGVTTTAEVTQESTTVTTVIPGSADIDDSVIEIAVSQSTAVSDRVSAEDPDKVIQIGTEEDSTGEVTLSPESMSAIADTGAQFRVICETGSMDLDSDVVITLTEPQRDVTVRMHETTDDDMTEAQREAKGDRFGVTMTATVGDDRYHLLGGTVTVTIPYHESMGADPSVLGVFYIDEDGVRTFTESVFDAVKNAFVFHTDHFSLFVVDEVPAPAAADNGDDTLLYAGIAVVVIVVIIAVAAVAIKKR